MKALHASERFELVAATDLRSPFAGLGGDAGRTLREVKRILGDDYLVPVRLGGTPKSPKLSLKRGFLEEGSRLLGRAALADLVAGIEPQAGAVGDDEVVAAVVPLDAVPSETVRAEITAAALVRGQLDHRGHVLRREAFQWPALAVTFSSLPRSQ